MSMAPLLEQRMLLWGFQGVPDVSYTLNVKGPLIGERDVPQVTSTSRISTTLSLLTRLLYPWCYCTLSAVDSAVVSMVLL